MQTIRTLLPQLHDLRPYPEATPPGRSGGRGIPREHFLQFGHPAFEHGAAGDHLALVADDGAPAGSRWARLPVRVGLCIIDQLHGTGDSNLTVRRKEPVEEGRREGIHLEIPALVAFPIREEGQAPWVKAPQQHHPGRRDPARRGGGNRHRLRHGLSGPSRCVEPRRELGHGFWIDRGFVHDDILAAPGGLSGHGTPTPLLDGARLRFWRGKRESDGMTLATRFRRRARGATSVTAALAMGLLVTICVPANSGAASATPGTYNTSEFNVPTGLAFGGGHLWVSNQAGNSLTEIDPVTGAWMGSFLGARYGFSHPTAITSAGADLFVANETGSLSEVRASNGAALRTISGSKFGFLHPVALAVSGHTVLVLNAGSPSATPAVDGSITEIDARSGHLLRKVSGSAFAFDDPIALAVSGPDTYIADVGNNSVTEIDTASGALVRVVTGQGLNTPDGITVADGHVWVADAGSNAATDIDGSTGAVLATVSDADGKYGFGRPSVAIQSGGNVFIASPFGTSPMVTKLSATTGTPSWYMCNTNGPYYFSLLSAFAISGNHLWVASQSGANSKTPEAKTGSLTELNTGSGALIATLPLAT